MYSHKDENNLYVKAFKIESNVIRSGHKIYDKHAENL